MTWSHRNAKLDFIVDFFVTMFFKISWRNRPGITRSPFVNEYRKDHIFELRRKTWIYAGLIIAVTHTTWAVVKLKPQKHSGLNGIRTHDLCDTGAVLHQLRYQAIWELAWSFVYAATSLFIFRPPYNGHFILARTKAQSVIFSFKEPITTARFLWQRNSQD